jgi:hypothetical protein
LWPEPHYFEKKSTFCDLLSLFSCVSKKNPYIIHALVETPTKRLEQRSFEKKQKKMKKALTIKKKSSILKGFE